jgi:hypothetical protein
LEYRAVQRPPRGADRFVLRVRFLLEDSQSRQLVFDLLAGAASRAGVAQSHRRHVPCHTEACAAKGAQHVLVSDGKVYLLKIQSACTSAAMPSVDWINAETDARSSRTSRPTAPASIEPLAMPTVDGSRLDQHQRVSPPRPHPSQDQPQQAVSWAKRSVRTSEYAQLVAQGNALEQQVSTRRPGESNRCDRPRDMTQSRVECPVTAPTSMGFGPDAILARDIAIALKHYFPRAALLTVSIFGLSWARFAFAKATLAGDANRAGLLFTPVAAIV